MGRKTRVIKIRWTGLIAIGNNNADNTDIGYGTPPVSVYMGGADTSSVTLNTKGAVTGSPTFDLHSYGTNDNSNWPAVTSQFQTNIFAAQAKNLVQTVAFNRGPRIMRFLIDVNTANLAVTEYVEITIFLSEPT